MVAAPNDRFESGETKEDRLEALLSDVHERGSRHVSDRDGNLYEIRPAHDPFPENDDPDRPNPFVGLESLTDEEFDALNGQRTPEQERAADWRSRPIDVKPEDRAPTPLQVAPAHAASPRPDEESLADFLDRERADRQAHMDRDDEEWDRTRNPFRWAREVSDEEFDAWSERMERDHRRRRAAYGPPA